MARIGTMESYTSVKSHPPTGSILRASNQCVSCHRAASRPARREPIVPRLVAVLSIVSMATLFQGQTPPPATGLVLGQIVDGSSGKPIAGVTVTLTATLPASPATASPPA